MKNLFVSYDIAKKLKKSELFNLEQTQDNLIKKYGIIELSKTNIVNPVNRCDCGGGCAGSCAGHCGGCGGSSCKGGCSGFVI